MKGHLSSLSRISKVTTWRAGRRHLPVRDVRLDCGCASGRLDTLMVRHGFLRRRPGFVMILLCICVGCCAGSVPGSSRKCWLGRFLAGLFLNLDQRGVCVRTPRKDHVVDEISAQIRPFIVPLHPALRQIIFPSSLRIPSRQDVSAA